MLILFGIGLVILLLFAVAASSSAKNANDQLTDKAKALHQKLNREQPDDELAKLGDSEFPILYRKAILPARRERLLTPCSLMLLMTFFLAFVAFVQGAFDLVFWIMGVGYIGTLVIAVIRWPSEIHMLDHMRANLDKASPAPPDRSPKPAASGAASGTTADQLQKLAELKEKGILDDEEFQREKAKLLR